MMKRMIAVGTMCAGIALGLSAVAQNATSGGDQDGFPPARMGQGPGQGQGARRGGATRGTVTAVSGMNVTMKTPAGETMTVIATDNTRVTRDGQPGSLAAIQPGDEVVAMGIADVPNHAVHAMMVMDVSAAQVAKTKADMGRTYIIGRVTGIDDTKITVMRPDKITQTIQLDDSTSIHRGGRMNAQALAALGIDASALGAMGGGGGMGGGGRRGANGAAGAPPASDAGEAITLADIKVGESIGGTGSLKGGVFVPQDLRVQDRPAGGRRGANGDAAAPPQ